MLLIYLIAISVLAIVWPTWVTSPEEGTFWADPFVATGHLKFALVAVTMFCVGVLLPRQEIAQVRSRWPTVLGGTCIQYVAMPLAALVFAKYLFALKGSEFVGVIMVGCVPGAMASNVLTLTARGNTSYSISLTTLATIVSPLAVPLALFLTLRDSIDPATLLGGSVTLMKYVVLPVLCGFGFAQFVELKLARDSQRTVAWMQRSAKFGAHVAILWIIANVVATNRDNLSQISSSLLWVLLLINLSGYGLGYLGGSAMGLPSAMRRALTLEVGMQNAGLGVALASELFKDLSGQSVAVAPAIYTFGCMLTGTLLAQIWSRIPLADSKTG